MGGKVWSDAEERYFWRTAMSFSPKRVGIDRSKPEKSWPQLATQMQSAMGGEARRQYTETMMFEHYFQNIESQRVSPNAVLYVYEYNTKKGRGDSAVSHSQAQMASTPPYGTPPSQKGNAAEEGEFHDEPRSSSSSTAAVPAQLPGSTEAQKMETGLKVQSGDLPSSGTPSLGPRSPCHRTLGGHGGLHSHHPYARVPTPSSSSPVYTGGSDSGGPLVVRRLPYAPDRDSQHTMRMPSSRFRQPMENTPAPSDDSLQYSGGDTSDYDEGEISEYDTGDTSESGDDISPN